MDVSVGPILVAYQFERSIMEKLPVELIQRIFSCLDYRPLASAAKVCRTWRQVTNQAELWKRLYERRWGPTISAKARVDISTLQSWKAAYEIQDRWDRVGEEMNIIREGNEYFLAQKGLLLRSLGSSNNKATDERAEWATKCPETGVRSSAPGLVDKLIQFVADMDHEHRRVAKRAHLLDNS